VTKNVAWAAAMVVCVTASATVAAQVRDVAGLIRDGQQSFNTGDYQRAESAFGEAKNHEPTSLNELRYAMATAHTRPLSFVLNKPVRTWLDKKKIEARAAGDKEASWDHVNALVNALQGAAVRQEQEIAIQTSLVAKQKRTIEKLETTVVRCPEEWGANMTAARNFAEHTEDLTAKLVIDSLEYQLKLERGGEIAPDINAAPDHLAPPE
jgi:hypothetical protein